MMKSLSLCAAAPIGAALFLMACGGDPSTSGGPAASGAPTTSARAAPSVTSAATAALTATAKADAPEEKATTVEIKGAKAAIKISVMLPPGVSDQSERPNMKEFRKSKSDFDGYSLMLGEDRPERAKGGLDIFVRQIEAQKDSKKTRLIDKATWEGGWAVSYEFEEGGKKNVGVMGSATAGDALVMCRGDASGSALTDVDAAAKVLLNACKSIKPAGG